MKFLKKALFALTLALIAIVSFGSAKDTYAQAPLGTMSPVYIPSVAFPIGTYSATVSTSTPTSAYAVQNADTICLQFTGTFSGLSATVEGSVNSPSTLVASDTWNTITVASWPEDKSKIKTITTAGLYCFATGGFKLVRVNVAALTIAGSNSLVINLSGTTGNKFVTTAVQRKRTFTTAFSVVAPATANADWATIAGSATAQIRIKEIGCWGYATAYTESISLIKRSTLDTGTAAANPTAVAVDSSDLGATATIATYTTAPSPVGTPVGTVRYLKQYLQASTVNPYASFVFTFGKSEDQDLILNSATENVALNSTTGTNAQTYSCYMTWEEI